MTKSLYYIECTAKQDLEFPGGIYKNNPIFTEGEIVYFNANASSKEMSVHYLQNPYSGIGTKSSLPFTRQKRFAKKWQVRRWADQYARSINAKGHFDAVVKEIKLTYEEEEV